MKKVASNDRYDYYIGWDEKGKAFFNLVPIGNPAPSGGYSKEWILRVKKAPDLFPKHIESHDLN